MKNIDENRPKVSVCIITYNHASYITECIESVLSQQCDFSLEVIVGDDGSNDETTNIVTEFSARHGNIRALTGEPNVGVKKNLKKVLSLACGQYIAVLEGDDYWHDVKKLQKQVDFMQANQNAILCFTSARVEIELLGIVKTSVMPSLSNRKQAEIRKNLWEGWFGIHTCTMIFTNEFIKQHLNSNFFREDLISGDWPLAMHASIIGEIGYLVDCTATYRITPNSIMNSGIATRVCLIQQQSEWWNIFKSNSDNQLIKKTSASELIMQKMNEIGYRPCTRSRNTVFIDRVGYFRLSSFRYFLFRLRRYFSLIRFWVKGNRK
ncbi:glycosyltransferase family 2 protein [Nitrosomonas sp. wSCUT-2]